MTVEAQDASTIEDEATEVLESLPLFAPIGRAAEILGVSRVTLHRRHKAGRELFRPQPWTERKTVFHRVQLRLIEAVLAGALAEDEACARWQAYRARLSAVARPGRERVRRRQGGGK